MNAAGPSARGRALVAFLVAAFVVQWTAAAYVQTGMDLARGAAADGLVTICTTTGVKSVPWPADGGAPDPVDCECPVCALSGIGAHVTLPADETVAVAYRVPVESVRTTLIRQPGAPAPTPAPVGSRAPPVIS